MIGARTFRWKRPEYVGENRCIPCTVVNLLLTVLLAAGVGTVQTSLGIAVAAVGVAAIYFRGYLVPGTPTLTKRYVPDRVLRLFDKRGEQSLFGAEPGDLPHATDSADVEQFLVDVGALEPCRDGEDLCLTSAFRDAWFDEIDRLSDADVSNGAVIESLFEGLDADGEVDTEKRPNAFVVRVGSTVSGKWESETAALADVAADSVLRDRTSAWEASSYGVRMEVLGALRLWLEQCPACEGAVTLGEETVESCCRSYEVVAAACDGCETRLFEARLPEGGL